MAIETFKAAKDYILIALMAWGVYEAREIKVTVMQISIKSAADAVEKEQMKQDIKDGKASIKELEQRTVSLEMLMPERINVKKNTSKDD